MVGTISLVRWKRGQFYLPSFSKDLAVDREEIGSQYFTGENMIGMFS
jgi:hypothetical protein